MTSAVAALVVYAYSSLAAPWGAAPKIATAFEKSCTCHVKLVDVGDGGSLISRLKLEGIKTQGDVILGVDQNFLPLLKAESQWQGLPQKIDYGPYAFVYNSKIVKDPPQSLDDLLDEKWKGQILIEDPRLSTAGLGFLLWAIREKGETETWTYLKKLKTQIKIVTPSWDLAYGLFKKGQAQLVFSYWTSPAYHIQEEQNKDFKAAPFKNGHYVQEEYMVINSSEKNKSLKIQFQKFMLTEFAQKELAKNNFMYPAVKNTPLTRALIEIGTAKLLTPLPAPSEVQLESWLKKWREIFS